MKMMKFEYDKEADAAYIYIEHPINKGAAKTTVEAAKNVFIDFDKKGRLLGIEVLDAKKILGKKAISNLA